MSSRRNWTLALLIALLAFMIIFEPSLGWRLRALVSPRTELASSATSTAADDQALKAELAQYEKVAAEMPTSTTENIRAMVYSRYPLNLKNELLVNAGSGDGVLPGAAATYGGIFLGKVKSVFSDSATVQTVFDSGFQMPVRIGAHGYDGLFRGGSYPEVGSIEKNAALTAGDIIYTAAPGLPYGLPVGIVAATSTSADSLFQVAAVGFAYDLNDIQTIFIKK